MKKRMIASIRSRHLIYSKFQSLSITVNPAYDSPERLKTYADSYGIEDKKWLFLTGDEKKIHRLAWEGFKVGSKTELVNHSPYFILSDSLQRIRGYYNSDDQYLSSKRKELPEGIWIGTNQNSFYSQYTKFWINEKGYIFEDQKQLFHSSILKLPGKHNLQNLLLVTAAAREIGLDHSSIAKSINSFKSIPHRLEYLGKVNNLSFYNDSKATNFDSSLTGLKSRLPPIILLAGGIQKKGDYLSWMRQIQQSTNGIVLFGLSANNLKEALLMSSYTGEIIVKQNLEEATIASIDIARKTNSKSILLSPACASFDQYQNYEERGDHFKTLVKKYS